MTSDDDFGPAILFCPAERSERFEKAVAASDTAAIDLEDGTAASAKDSARAAVLSFLKASPHQVMVRINHPTTQRGLDDAASVMAAGCRTLLLPKTESGAEIDAVRSLHSAPKDLKIFVTIETARGVLALSEILERPGVAACSWGPYDLAADMGFQEVRDPDNQFVTPILHLRNQIILAAAAARIPMFDTVTTELRDSSILAQAAHEAARFGMRGKFSIHPSQVKVIRTAFRPTTAEVERCKRLLAAIPAEGAFLFEGEMIDEPIIRRAQHTIAQAEQARRTKV